LSPAEPSSLSLHDALPIFGGDRHAGRLRRDAGIAGCAVEGAAQGRGGERPAEGMLPAAAADHEYAHEGPPSVPSERGGLVSSRPARKSTRLNSSHVKISYA